jgi:hypothetical protein
MALVCLKINADRRGRGRKKKKSDIVPDLVYNKSGRDIDGKRNGAMKRWYKLLEPVRPSVPEIGYRQRVVITWLQNSRWR